PEIAGGGDRAGGWWHEGVGGIQAGRQRHAHGYHGDFHPRRQGVLQRVEDNVAGVTKYRDRHQIADDRHRKGGKPLTQQLDDGFGHGDGRAAALKDHADNGTEDNDDPDVAENATKAAGDVTGDLQGR